MSWHDQDGPWSRAARRRVRFLTAATIIHSLFGILAIIATVTVMDAGLMSMVIWIMPLVMIASTAAFVRTRHRVNQLKQRIPGRNGAICPKCWLDIDEHMACPRCARNFSLDELQEYWTEFFVVPRVAMERRARLLQRSAARGHLLQRIKSLPLIARQSPRGLIVFTTIVWLPLILLSSWLFERSFIGSVIEYSSVMLGVLGASLVLIGTRHTHQGTAHCAQCNYQRAPQNKDVTRCPECNAAWSEPGGLIRVRRERQSTWIAVGVICMVCAAVVFGGKITQSGLLSRLMPTSALIQDVGGYDPRLMAELRKRTLSPDEHHSLIVHLLDRRDNNKHLHSDARNWLATELLAGRIAQQDRVRLFNGIFHGTLDTPRAVQFGETFNVTLKAEYHGTLDVPAGLGTAIFIEGFNVNDQPAPTGIELERSYPLLLAQAPEYTVRHAVRAVEMKDMSIAMAYWIVVGPSALLPHSAALDVDGQLVLPPGITWVERRVITADVGVVRSE
jgi:hypothetical protein